MFSFLLCSPSNAAQKPNPRLPINMDDLEQNAENNDLTFPTARIDIWEINPNWISFETIREWKRTCTEEHLCGSYPRFGAAPAWLIDVVNKRLVSTEILPDPPTYCALSYVWGNVETTKLTLATQQMFCHGGAFSEDGAAVVIPRTIRHAMKLVEAMGWQYLWVDSLCIIQDDERHFHSELRNMGAIYNNAMLTIVATTGYDANDGLRGLRGISGPRELAWNHADDLHKYLVTEGMVWVCAVAAPSSPGRIMQMEVSVSEVSC